MAAGEKTVQSCQWKCFYVATERRRNNNTNHENKLCIVVRLFSVCPVMFQLSTQYQARPAVFVIYTVIVLPPPSSLPGRPQLTWPDHHLPSTTTTAAHLSTLHTGQFHPNISWCKISHYYSLVLHNSGSRPLLQWSCLMSLTIIVRLNLWRLITKLIKESCNSVWCLVWSAPVLWWYFCGR